MNKFRTVVSILCGVAGLFLGASLNNAIGGCILGVLISALPKIKKGNCRISQNGICVILYKTLCRPSGR